MTNAPIAVIQGDRVPAWVDGTGGSDANSGLTAALPKATIQAAVNLSGPNRILVQNGIYRETVTIAKPLEVVNALSSGGSFGDLAADDLAHMVDIRGSSSMPTWTLNDGPSATWQAAYAATCVQLYASLLITPAGLWTRLSQVATLALVKTTPGSYSQPGGTGTTVYCHLPDDSDPNAAGMETAARSICVDVASTCSQLLLEGIACTLPQGRGVSIYKAFADQGGDYEFRGCVFRYAGTDGSATGHGLTTSGILNTRCVTCQAYANALDGFNFHMGGAHELHMCRALHNRDDGASPHEQAHLTVRGGRFAHNGKAGLIAVLGASMDVYGAAVTDNVQGISVTDARTFAQVDWCKVTRNQIGLYARDNAYLQACRTLAADNGVDRIIDASARFESL